ncbi:MAG TPA: hypothetical protein VLL52_07140 [Anaerolineae bacterium]|nr:hypothetical protein [Anaerolineae bacterium]
MPPSNIDLPLSAAGFGGGDDKETKWEVVTNTLGLTPAQMIAGRLQAEGIPAHAWQQSAGQAFGLLVGGMGTGYVSVPQPYADHARELLQQIEEEFANDAEAAYLEWEEE